MIKIEDLPDRLSIAEINELTRYSTNITAYQMLRLKGVKPVGKRPMPGKSPDVNVYDRDMVLKVFQTRIRSQQKDSENA